jgi:LysM repeat protein
MTEFSHPRRVALWTLCVALVAVSAAARESGEPQRFHVVYPGQRLTTIAKRYKVSVDAIRTANGLGKAERLKVGEKLTIPGLDDPDGSKARALYPPPHPTDVPTVPASARKDRDDKDDDADRSDGDSDDGPRTHKVYAGQRLESIAKRYKITVDALCSANGITRRVKLHAGQVLNIPRPGEHIGAKTEDDDIDDKHKLPRLGLRKGYLDLFTYSSHFRGYAVDKKGKVTPLAEAEVSKLFGAGGPHPVTDPRLIRQLAKVSDHFGSRPIRIVSGYRTRSFFEDSRHKVSCAVDFSIPGVDNGMVRDYLRSLSDVGVGYYPNSSFVHLDVRDTNTYWVDFAGPGEAPRHTNKRDHDEEAEGDLHDPEVSEGDRPSEREAATLAAPSAELGAGTAALPTPATEPAASSASPAVLQNAPK